MKAPFVKFSGKNVFWGAKESLCRQGRESCELKQQKIEIMEVTFCKCWGADPFPAGATYWEYDKFRSKPFL